MAGTAGRIVIQPIHGELQTYPPFTTTNSPDVFQPEAWGGGPVPPGVPQVGLSVHRIYFEGRTARPAPLFTSG
jgi:hypothetical protein